MPVFFVLSGFFTAMLWRGRGLKSLLSHRFRRVLLPFLLGLVTIVPAVNWISGWATASALEAKAAKADEDNIWSAAKTGDLAAIERHLQGGADIDGTDPAFGQTPLVWPARPPDELICKGIFVSAVRRIVEEDEAHLIETVVRFEKLLHCIKSDDRGLSDRITVHTSADGREGNRLDAVLYYKP